MEPIKDNNLISDNFCIHGTDFNLFEKSLLEFDKITEVITVNPKQLSVIHIEKVDNEKIRLVNIPSNISKTNYIDMVKNIIRTGQISKDSLIKKIGSSQLVDELEETGFMLLNSNNNKNMLISKDVVSLLTRHLDITSATSKSDIARDLYIASKLYEKEESLQFVIKKTSTNAKKIFGVFSDRYKRTPYALLARAIRSLSKISSYDWTITNRMVEIFAFKKNKIIHNGVKIIPGYHLCTSDTGSVGFKIEACIKLVKGKKETCVILEGNQRNSIRHICIQDNEEYIDFDDLIKIADKEIEVFYKKIEELFDNKVKNKDSLDESKTFLLDYAKNSNMDKVIGLKHIKNAVNQLNKIEYEDYFDVISNLCLLELPQKSWSTERKIMLMKGTIFMG